jgi:phage terminase small subunit
MTKRTTARPKTKPKAKAKRAAKPKPAPTVILKSAEGINGEQIAEPKLTIKQEKFAQAYVETGNASEAYRRAYDASGMKADVIHVKASELLASGKVAVRVQDLKAAHRERHEITVDDLVAELEEAREIAARKETPAAMVAASMGKAKLLGLVVDKGELTGKNGEPLNPVREVSELESARRVAFILGKGMRRLKEDGINGVDLNGAYAPPAESQRSKYNPATGEFESA